MTKAALVEGISTKTGLSKADAAKAVEAFGTTIRELAAAGKRTTLPGFGTFKNKHRAERPGFNPRTREPIRIAVRDELTFKEAR